MFNYLIALILIFVPLYPKFPLLGVSGTFVAVRLEDFVLAGVLIVWGISNLRRKFIDLSLPVHRSILLYLSIGFVSVFAAVFVTKTAALNLGVLHALRRVEYMTLFFVAFQALKTHTQLTFLIRTFLVVSLLVAIFGLGQQFLGWPIISTTNSEFSKGLALTLGAEARINSTFAGHYDLAAFSLFPLLLVIALLALPQVRSKWALLATGSLVYWAMLLSASRVTFASFFVSATVLLLVIRKLSWIAPLIMLAIISIIVTPQLLGRYKALFINHVRAAPAADEVIPDTLKPPAVPEDRSFNIRLKAEWPKAMRAFYQNPILGTGFSSVGLAVDNDYLRLLAETGALGLLAFGLVLIRIFKSSRPFLHAPKSVAEAFVVVTTLGLLGLLFNAMFIDVFEASKIAVITWVLLGTSEKAKKLA